jgi:molybdate transport system permease protein
VWLTLAVAARSVGFGLPLAVAVAFVLARCRFPGRPLLDALVYLPMVLPPVVVGWLLLLTFGVRGPIGAWLQAWFGIRLVFTTAGAALACAVMAFPLMVRAACLGEFGAVITFAANIPGQTQTLPLAIYAALQTPNGEAVAARLSLVSVLLAVAGLLLADQISKRLLARVGR